jgi:hypothetical protein
MRLERAIARCVIAALAAERLDAVTETTLGSATLNTEGLLRLAWEHRVAPAFAEALTGRRLPVELNISEELIASLDLLRRRHRRRTHILRRQLLQAVRLLNGIGVEPTLLKGTIRLVDGLYPSPAWRFMRDLDLLVPQERLTEAAGLLMANGYSPKFLAAEWRDDHHHAAPLQRGADEALVELHHAILGEAADLLSASEMAHAALPRVIEDARLRIPRSDHQLIQLVAHDRFDGELTRGGTFLLRSAVETELLARIDGVLTAAVTRFRRSGRARIIRVHLERTARLLPGGRIAGDTRAWRRLTGLDPLTTLELADTRGMIRRAYWFLRSSLERGAVAGAPR